MTAVTRFAPSPTGRLHVGNIFTAVHNFLTAKKAGGRFLLRLDDTDRARSTEAFAQAIRDDIAWLGLTPDAEVKQSDRFAAYDAALAKLHAAGRAYPCYESPEELDIKRKVQLSRGLPPVYDRAALKLTDTERARLEGEGIRPHWRFKLDHDGHVEWDDLIRGHSHIDPASLSDPVVRRADGGYLYMLPSVVDDIDLGITHVVRGEDHVANSGIQLQMFAALGATPPKLAHFGLLTSVDGELSKRLGSAGMDALREAGIEPIAVVAMLARLGTADAVEPVASLDSLIAGHDLSRLGNTHPRFDPAELQHLNARIVHQLPFEAVRDRLPGGMDTAAWEVIRANLTTVGEAADWWQVVEGPVTAEVAPEDAAYLAEARATIAELPWGADIWQALVERLKASTGRKGKPLFLPLRRALTGRDHGPEMAALLSLIGRARALERLTF
ncbi:glutamate--tRNA ligase [Sphingoaurantiacus capsulatus]|uniref:Glutamate--tRNA ligase n=1 Tax=Sphingoaurantiacus capsulatus TaxID=1771310 RepID=A0ABV7X7K7_9SPHN